MPNWCFTSYVIVGDQKEITSLYGKMKRLQKMEWPLLPNGFGSNWLGCLVKRLGGNPNSVYCRGSFGVPRLRWRGEMLTFNTETAWARMDEVENLIRSVYPSLSVYFIEEELGNGIFETNDEFGVYFPENVIIGFNNSGMDYYTEENALKKLSELKGGPVNTWKEAEDFVTWRNEHLECEDDEIWLHKAEIVS